MSKLDPEIERLLGNLPDDDLKDFLAMHGAGSFKRQFKAHLKNDLAENLPWFSIFVLIAGAPGLLVLILFISHLLSGN